MTTETIISNRYLVLHRLVELLDQLFPNQWSLKTQGDSTLIKAPRALSEDQINSVQDLDD
ncbi:hypothetical protein BDD12DRAFT_870743 [Trichophaea hybrida]|nr:hypothetical protein BDD12DRAFT_870743 [Trichophaea hybrida]